MQKRAVVIMAMTGLLGLTLATTAQAKSVNYQALTYGTTKTSIASKYFVKPAKVAVKNKHYVVTMHLKTAKALGKYPVQVLRVNGAKPQHVRKVRDKADNSNIYYSFTTKSLKRAVTAKLSINVLHVYHATHAISFKFKTSQLPKLTAHVRMVTQAKHASNTKTVTPAKKGPTLLLTLPRSTPLVVA
ncbi:NEAT domain-containing protein [Lactiplantibacillus daowaiensis]|uniref:NEAT domain-containing protein n=1 Tax=Lactiplantibacillus daowaiensis TaxID=2559918 RepID=A0ABW1S127_9LACO|nr:NEAT domain-containing protein [Lactiplantibacillus daowaiensis]